MSTSVQAARDELAPTGTLRVGLNLANFLLTREDKAANTIRGIAPDLAHEIGRRLGVPVQFFGYPRPGKVADDALNNKWDIAFLGAEPQRAQQIDFTSAYFEIEATYLLPPGSPIKTMEEVDAPGRRISIAGGSAYDLYLTRELKHAKLERADSVDGSFEHFVKEKTDVLAGLRPRLVKDQENLPGSHLMEGRFTAIQQAIGVAKSPARTGAGYAFLKEFVADAIRNGLVAQAITANGVRGGSVAPLP